MSAATDPVITAHEAAEEIGVAYCTVLDYLRSGVLVGVKRGNRWYVRRSRLDQFLEPETARVAS